MRVLIPGYDPETDGVETSDTYEWPDDAIMLARVRRGPLKLIMPAAALIDPWPEEFLWRPLKALGVVDVWWTMHRSVEHPPWAMTCLHQMADGWVSTCTVSRELVADREAWASYRRIMFRKFLGDYQEALDKRDVATAAL
jgi:hypothetical protein